MESELPEVPYRVWACGRRKKKPRWWVWDSTNNQFATFSDPEFMETSDPSDLRIVPHPKSDYQAEVIVIKARDPEAAAIIEETRRHVAERRAAPTE